MCSGKQEAHPKGLEVGETCEEGALVVTRRGGQARGGLAAEVQVLCDQNVLKATQDGASELAGRGHVRYSSR